MAFLSQQFHQSVFSIPGIQPEGQPDKQRTGDNSERNTYPLVHTSNEQYNEQEEQHNKTTSEDEQVLQLEPFELYQISHPLFYLVLHYLRGKMKEEWQQPQSRRYKQEPVCRCLADIRITAAELTVGLDINHKPYHRTNSATQFRGGSKYEVIIQVASLTPTSP